MYCNTPKKQSQELFSLINNSVQSHIELASIVSEVQDFYSFGYIEYSKDGEVKTQEVNTFTPAEDTPLKDEFEKKFIPKKETSILLSESYYRISEDVYTQVTDDLKKKFLRRSSRVYNCGTLLEFVKDSSDSKYKLNKANFCRNRLCPMCNWRRSMKKYSELSKILDYCEQKYKGCRYLFLTLTIPNVVGDDLIESLDCLLKAWKRFAKYKQFKKSVIGWFRSLEITYNRDKDTFHPHFHVVLAVPSDYFCSSVLYICHDTWLEMWKEACNDFPVLRGDDILMVNIEAITDKKKGTRDAAALRLAVLESSKYAVKSVDYIFPDNPKLTDYLVSIFAVALENRRLCDYGGILKEGYKALGMSEKDDDDLIHTGDSLRGDVAEVLVFHWFKGRYNNIYRK